jgi:diguanylate cyclase (GGDEF)-like protein/PAS domain S-box-containing protein
MTYTLLPAIQGASTPLGASAEPAGDALREGEAYFRSLVENARDVIHVINADRTTRYITPSVTHLLGWTPEELIGRSAMEIVHPDDAGPALAQIRAARETPSTGRPLLLRVAHRDGSWRLFEAVGRNLLDDPVVRGVIINSRDVTERVLAEERLLHGALHDALTGLPNRHAFMERLGDALLRYQRQGVPFAVLFLDLDRFKVVNDSLGHHVGDELLVAVARRLQAGVREHDVVARFGGDEFAVLLEGRHGHDHATRIAERLAGEVAAPVNLSGYEVYTSASIGIALASAGYDRPEYLLRGADMAMYRAKAAAGGAPFEVFDRAMHADALSRLQVETDLRRALVRGELTLRYQPIVSLRTGKVAGVEALCRWLHPDRGLVAPAEFIPIAEETGLIVELGAWVIGEAARQLAAWRAATGARIAVSVNLSARQFARADLAETVRAALAETGLKPRHLKLEITESALVDSGAAGAVLDELSALGVELQLDDFGTGYSSLSALHRLPIRALKVDRSFLTRLEADAGTAQLVRTIVLLARGLELVVIAEGVETPAQLAEVRALGCDYAQGFLLSPPLEAAAMGELLASDPRW